MMRSLWRRGIHLWLATAGVLLAAYAMSAAERHFLYVAEPGIRNYVEYGGVGILVFDADHGYRFVKRIPTWETAPGKEPENVKGIAASAATGKLYVSTFNRVAAFDILSGKKVWDKAYPGGCDRLAISPDGRTLYVPSFESAYWDVVDAATGDMLTRIQTNSGSHNTIYGPDGKRVYLAGLRSPLLSVADTASHTVVEKVGPFSNVIRPFTINGSQTLCFVNVNELLGFEVGDLRTGKMLYRVEVQGFQKGPVKRHGCPSHGIALTPDEKELWVTDGANDRLHIFDASVMPPKQVTSIVLRDMPGWITFSIDGRFAYPSTGEVIDTHTKKIIATLWDEAGRQVQSEKMLELDFEGDKVVRAGNQFGIGSKK
ncbi:MAG TPA: YncE family protein [Bryobacteraceae bacterium]|nr:YncE family protein [Bryobacteraceae bacterium]